MMKNLADIAGFTDKLALALSALRAADGLQEAALLPAVVVMGVARRAGDEIRRAPRTGGVNQLGLAATGGAAVPFRR